MVYLFNHALAPRKVDLTTPIDEVMTHLREDGAVIVQGILNLDTVRKLNEEVDPVVKGHHSGLKYSEYKETPGDTPEHEVYNNEGGQKTKHVRDLVLTSETFRNEILNHKWMHAVCEQIYSRDFGDYWMNCAHILHLGPGEKAQQFHRDSSVYRVSDFRRGSMDPEFMINFLVSLTEFREDNGATRLIPGSHHWDVANQHMFQSSDEAVPALLQPGDAVVYFGSLFHGAGENRSSNYRRGVIISLHPSHFTSIESHLHLPKDVIDDMTPLAQRMIGRRAMLNQNKIPIWQTGDDKIEEALRQNYKEVY